MTDAISPVFLAIPFDSGPRQKGMPAREWQPQASSTVGQGGRGTRGPDGTAGHAQVGTGRPLGALLHLTSGPLFVRARIKRDVAKTRRLLHLIYFLVY